MVHRTTRPNARIIRIAIILILGILLLPYALRFDLALHGTKDFVAYWSAHNLYRAGQNPYDLDALHAQQLHLGYNPDKPQVVWNAPWIFPLLSPFLGFNFRTSTLIWWALNMILLFFIPFATWQTIASHQVKPLSCLFSGVLFFPALVNLSYGQLSLFITAGVIGCFWSLKRKKDILAGFFLLFPTIKPHLIYLVIPVLFLWIIRNRRWKVAFSFMGWFALLNGILLMKWPSAFSDWLLLDSTPLVWRSVTVITFIRDIISLFFKARPSWPVIAIPLFFLAYFSIYFSLFQKEITWPRCLPPLICWSLFTAPYGWLFDQSLAVITQVAVIASLVEAQVKKRDYIEIVFWLAFIQATLLAQLFVSGRLFSQVDQSLTAWFPFVLVLIWYRSQYMIRKYPREHSIETS